MEEEQNNNIISEEEDNKNDFEKKEVIEGIKRVAEYLEYVSFMAMPKILRKKTFQIEDELEFANKYELSQNTLTNWKKREDFWKRVQRQVVRWGRGQTPNVLKALLATAQLDGKAPEVKLWLQFFEQWSEKKKIDISGTVDYELNEEDKNLLKQAIEYGRVNK